MKTFSVALIAMMVGGVLASAGQHTDSTTTPTAVVERTDPKCQAVLNDIRKLGDEFTPFRERFTAAHNDRVARYGQTTVTMEELVAAGAMKQRFESVSARLLPYRKKIAAASCNEATVALQVSAINAFASSFHE